MKPRALYTQDETGRVRRSAEVTPKKFKARLLLLPGLVLAVLATSNLFIPNISGTILTDPTIVALGAAIVLAVGSWVNNKGFIGKPHLLIILLVFTFLPGILAAAPHEYGQSKTVGLILTFMALLVTTQVVGSWHVEPAFLVALAAFGVLVAVALLALGETSTFEGRASVLELNPIGLGRMAALGSMLCLLTAYWGRGRWRILLLVAAIISAFAATATGSRAPLIAAGIAVAFALLVSRRPASPVVRIAGVGFLAAGIYLFYRSGGLDASSRLLSLDSSGRDALWSESIGIALNTPGGLGFGGLYGHISLSPGAVTTGYSQYSHNLFLETAVEGGWVALAGLLLVLIVSLRRLLMNSTTQTGAVLLAVWTFAFINSMASSDLVGNRLLWVMIAVGLGLELRQAHGNRTPKHAGAVIAVTSRPTRPRRLTRSL